MPNAAPTEPPAAAPRIGCIVLAAGRSRRYGRTRINKLLATIAGAPLITHVLRAVAGAGIGPVVIVTGHQRQRVERVVRTQRGRHWPLRLIAIIARAWPARCNAACVRCRRRSTASSSAWPTCPASARR